MMCCFRIIVLNVSNKITHSTGTLRKLAWVASDLTCVSEVPATFLSRGYSDWWSVQVYARVLFSQSVS
jgi:hypothetical protein